MTSETAVETKRDKDRGERVVCGGGITYSAVSPPATHFIRASRVRTKNYTREFIIGEGTLAIRKQPQVHGALRLRALQPCEFVSSASTSIAFEAVEASGAS